MLRGERFAFREDLVSQLHNPFDTDDLTCPMVLGCGSDTSSMMENGMRIFAQRSNAELFRPPGTDHFVHTNSPSALAEMIRMTVKLGEG